MMYELYADRLQLRRPPLPEFLQEVKPSCLALLNVRAGPYASPSIGSNMAGMTKGLLTAANPIARRIILKPFPVRQMSTASALRIQHLQTPFTKIIKPQRRTIFGGNAPRNLLAHMEETANKNPTSASAQNVFYQALLRANMPQLVVERFQSGQFASNSACEAAYQKALATQGQADAGFGGGNFTGQTGSLNSQQLQAIGQAVAASSRGGNVAVARGQGTPGSTG